ncbi:chloramphenicol phosphotransferase CPT family protein [Photobacterium sp. 53610]|uniref:chloramphenicol phosphotransferase CPT family protein n=1 Tax=Photobacterium sp. 53610 TaxID=3102789 RepID=UPI002ED97B01
MDIIFLNGPSSSGKSAIAKALQGVMADDYLHIGIDTFIAMMPAKANTLNESDTPAHGFYWRTTLLNQQPVNRISSGPYGKAVNDAYRTTVRHLVDAGLKVIVDDVLNGSEEMTVWQSVLAGKNCLYVGVTCSAETLIQREQQRGDRHTGSAIEQASRVHCGIEYDLLIHTDDCSPYDSAKQIHDFIVSHDSAR